MGKDNARATTVFGKIDELATRVVSKSGDDIWTNMGCRSKDDEIVTVSSTFTRNRRVTFIYGGTRLVVYRSITGKVYHYLYKRGRGKFLTTKMVRAWHRMVDLP